MDIRIKRFSKDVPLPEYKTHGAAAFDLSSRERVVIECMQVGSVPLNVAIETPVGFFLLLASRSSTHKKGLMLANGIGIGDPDFSGDADEYRAVFFNFTSNTVVIEPGERVAQGLFVPVTHASWIEVPSLRPDSRGGFGSTGSY
ncbi:MAG: hypothetical protein RIQ54_359 [Candidatus Parcubacteria bacterium]|jgi:dUTP pyrophosphatase